MKDDDSTTSGTATDRFTATNNIKLHYLHHQGAEPPLILMPGLTANAHSFDAIIDAGIRSTTLALDLRGRGRSDKPDQGYTIEDHAADILGMLDKLGMDKAIIGGHSFGGLLGVYLAVRHPDRVAKIIIIDAAARLHPNAGEMIAPSVGRLGKEWPSFDDYMKEIKEAPFLKGKWLPAMESYYRADVKQTDDGSYTTNTSPGHIGQVIQAATADNLDWPELIGRVTQPAILINALENYGEQGPILPEEMARETVDMMKACKYMTVPGNHYTMLYGEGAEGIAAAINDFIATG